MTANSFAFNPLFAGRFDYSAGEEPTSVYACDLDGDADADLAVANYWSFSVPILLNNGDGTFQAAVDYGAGRKLKSVFADDLDRDQDADLAVSNGGSN